MQVSPPLLSRSLAYPVLHDPLPCPPASLHPGAAWPLFAYLFGNVAQTVGDPSAGDAFVVAVRSVALDFVYLACGSFVASCLQTWCLMLSGVRQTNRLRTRYLASLLRQPVAFFDVDCTTGRWAVLRVGGVRGAGPARTGEDGKRGAAVAAVNGSERRRGGRQGREVQCYM